MVDLAQVLCSVMEQVKRFRDTNYPPDGRTEAEADFEDALEVSQVKSRQGISRLFYGMVITVVGPRQTVVLLWSTGSTPIAGRELKPSLGCSSN